MAAKVTKLNPNVRAACAAIFAIRKERGLTPRWTQAEHIPALARLAEAWREGNLVGDDGKPKEFTRADFMLLGEYGFFGNASQFRQALENLPAGDDLKLAPGTGSDTEMYK